MVTMSNLTIYNPEASNLNEVAFVRETGLQTRIKDISGYEISKQFGILFTKLSVAGGIKGEISDFDKRDIKEMILRRFKNLSLNEIDYAFKLERCGDYGDRIEHYQLFNAEYVSKILDRYREWKRNVKLRHNISEVQKKPELSEKEKMYWRNRGVSTSLEIYQSEKKIPINYTYVYDILYEDYLPKDAEYKRKKYESAKLLLQMEYSEKEATTREENKEIKNFLNSLEVKGNDKVKVRAKQLVLEEFYRNLLKDEKATNEFKEKYQY